MTIAGLVFVGLFWVAPRVSVDKQGLTAVIVFGLAMRVLFFGSTPISEDDWYRYLWDGAAVSHGVNPYAHAPAIVSQDPPDDSTLQTEDASLQQLRIIGEQHTEYLSRINYPYVSTIYPPLAQISFAAAHMIRPFSLDAWRFVLLIADCAALLLLITALNITGRSQLWSLLYWWNPIVIVTTFNAGHMDVLLAPFLLGAVLLVLKNRPYWAATALAGAVGVKFWPLILAPILFAKWTAQPFKLIRIASLVTALSLALTAPMLLSLDLSHSGLAAYAQSWERNAFLFPLIASGMDAIIVDGDFWARVFVALVVCGGVLGAAAYVKFCSGDIMPALLFATAILLFLSPTGYPWYFVWVAMFLPFAPSIGISALAATLPVYYLRFPLQETGFESVFNTYLVPIEFLIPLGVILWERLRARA